MPINVKDPQFGAKGDGSVDDSVAIQNAINYASSLSANPSAKYSATVYFPAGYYLISTPINITNKIGVWLVGDGGPYLNTIILGNTGSRAIFDFSGSSHSGCENFTFLNTGTPTTSTSSLAVQFALTSTGGLNCGIRRCYFQLVDNPTANGGFGSIGILNIRSEEFYIRDCVIRTNTPLILSARSDISAPGATYTASSTYQTVTSGLGSMGVTTIDGSSFQSLQKRQPAMVLVNTNSLNFHGYLARSAATAGSNETAILCVGYTFGLKVHATIESFSRILQIQNAGLDNSEIDVVIANSTSPTTELIDVTNSTVTGLQARVAIPNTPERANRYILYHAPANGNQRIAGSVFNSDIICYNCAGNLFMITPNLLRTSVNIGLHSNNPFEKRGGRIRLLTNTTIPVGLVQSINSIVVFRFQLAVQTPAGGTNGGYYRVWIEGTFRAGGYGSGALSVLCFQAQIVVNQRNDGSFDPPSSTVIILDQTTTNAAYLNITSVLTDITFSNGVGQVTLTPRVIGTGGGEPVNYDGMADIRSDFFINDPIPL